jgi:8-oxo-dGTP diphosphatase
MTNVCKVGIGVAVLRDNPVTSKTEVLMGQRKGSHGEGEWSFPGGHLEYMEAFEETAVRELAEEVGPNFIVEDFRVVSIINLVEYAPKHYLDVGMECWWVSGDPVVMEADKVEQWEWFDVENLPSPRFATIDRILAGARFVHCDGVAVFDKEYVSD